MSSPLTSSRCGHDLAPVGRSARTGGYHRSPFAAAEREAPPGSSSSARRRGLDVERDALRQPRRLVAARRCRAGRRCSPARTSTRSPTAVRTTARSASSRRSPPSTCCATAASRPSRPIGVGVFVEEEGSRFGLACLGSRLATGTITWDRPAALRDRDGVSLEDAMAGVEPGDADLLADGSAASWSCTSSRAATWSTGTPPVGVASGDLAARPLPLRLHRGGQPRRAPRAMEDRHDPMLTYAMTVLAANKQARLTGQRATFGRLDVHPTAPTPSRRGSPPGSTRAAESAAHLEAMLVATSSGWRRSAPAATAPRCGDRRVGLAGGALRRRPRPAHRRARRTGR